MARWAIGSKEPANVDTVKDLFCAHGVWVVLWRPTANGHRYWAIGPPLPYRNMEGPRFVERRIFGASIGPRSTPRECSAERSLRAIEERVQRGDRLLGAWESLDELPVLGQNGPPEWLFRTDAENAALATRDEIRKTCPGLFSVSPVREVGR